MPELSVFIITLNEEENIRECLESVKWASEIVVADSGSTDRTLEICAEYHCRVFHQEWLGFGRQKNLAMEHCSHDWVFNIDADERLTPWLQKEIQQVMQRDPPCDGYRVIRRNYFLGRWIKYGGWYPDYNLRLFNRRKGRFKEREVHERVEVEGKTGRLSNPLQHFTYKDLSDYLRRMDRYSALAARQMDREGRRTTPFKLLLNPLFTVFKMYILQQGWRDGGHGLILAGLYGAYTFTKYAKLWELQSDFHKRENGGRKK